MKINAKELLLVNKKALLQEGESTGTISAAPVEPESPQTAMNALMFKGMSNLMSNPGLAQHMGIMKEVNPNAEENNAGLTNVKSNTVEEPVTEAKSTMFRGLALNEEEVDTKTENKASFYNHFAFQGKSKAAKAALTGLAAIAATTMMTSCIQTDIDIDMTAINEMIAQMQALMQQMVEQQTMTNKQLQEMNAYILELMQLVRDGQISQEEFYKRMYEFMLVNQTNQEIIIAQLVANGRTAEEAKQLIQDLINAVNNHEITMEEALARLQELLGSIDAKLSVIINCMNDLKSGVDKLVEQGEINQQKADEIKALLENLLAEVRAGRMTQEEFYRQALRYMVVDNMMSRAILNQLVKNGKTEQEANELINRLIALVSDQNASLEELKAALDEIRAILGSIDGTLKEINETLKGLASDFRSFVKSYEENEKRQTQLLKGIYKNGRIQTEILAQSMYIQSQMASDINALKNSTNEFKNLVNTRFDELIETLNNIAGNQISREDLEAMLNKMGISITEAINMSQSQLIAAIQNFENTYIATEQQQTEELQAIHAQLNAIQYFMNMNTAAVINALNNLSAEMAKGNGNVLKALAELKAELAKIEAQLDAIYKRIDKAAKDVNTRIDMLNNKMSGVLGQLYALNKNVRDIKGELKNIKNAQLVANGYLSNLNNSVIDIKNAINELKDKMGDNANSITYEQLKELWEERDADKLAKLEEMLNKFGFSELEVNTKTIVELLRSIDAKMDMIKSNNNLLAQILDKLTQFADRDPQALLNKLDQIIELLKNFKCDCNCSNGNNEGILDALDGILG